LSLSLRHGAPVNYVVEQLRKDEKEPGMHSFSRVMARVLKRYVKDDTVSGDTCSCGNKLVYQEGCNTCTNCGFSACS